MTRASTIAWMNTCIEGGETWRAITRNTLTRRRFVQSTAVSSLALAALRGVGQAQAA